MPIYAAVYALSFVVSFIVAFGLGANDVSNAFATSVGAKVLTLYQACVIASFAEMTGALLMGSKVTATIARNIIDPDVYVGELNLLMLGMFCALLSTAVWLILATYLKLPVSATHCVVSSILGFGIAAKGVSSVKWGSLGRIGVSWVASPLVSGSTSAGLMIIVSKNILDFTDSYERALKFIPFIYVVSICVNVGPVVFDLIAAVQYRLNKPVYSGYMRLGISVGVSFIVGIMTAIFCRFYLIPKLRSSTANLTYSAVDGSNIQLRPVATIDVDEITDLTEMVKQPATPDYNSSDEEVLITNANDDVIMEPEDDLYEIAPTEKIFSNLQILTAVFTSFNHGGNDVSNAIGPLVAIILIYNTGSLEQLVYGTPMWVLAFGGVGIILGLSIWGSRVIETVGKNLTPMSPSKGFCIEMGAAFTVLMASVVGLPVSSTHCKVGSVVAVGLVSSQKSVNHKLLLNIVAR